MALPLRSTCCRVLKHQTPFPAQVIHKSSTFAAFSTHSHYSLPRRGVPDETTLSGAQHRPSLSGPSLGHLISELSATTPQMIKDGLRIEGQTMAEEQRTFARRVTLGVIGLPLVIGTGLVAWGIIRTSTKSQTEGV